MVSPVSRWRVDTRSHHNEQLQIRLLQGLVDSHIQQAVILCNRLGEILWANRLATSEAFGLGTLATRNGEYVIANPQLLRLIQDERLPPNGEPVHRFIAADRLFLEIALQAAQSHLVDDELIAMTIDCHVLEDCAGHSLAELSRAEYLLVKSLESHRCLKEAASDLGISYENARTKLKRIFEKLDVHSQRELMSKVHHITDSSAAP